MSYAHLWERSKEMFHVCVCDLTHVLCAVRLSLSGEASAFEEQASSAVLDLMGDEGDHFNRHKKIMKW